MVLFLRDISVFGGGGRGIHLSPTSMAGAYGCSSGNPVGNPTASWICPLRKPKISGGTVKVGTGWDFRSPKNVTMLVLTGFML